MRQVALLRGVNLGKRQVIMSELRALCEGAGFTDVRTLLASGNLVLDAKEKGAKLEAKLEKLVLEEMGLKTDVFVRTGAELKAIIAANPFKAFAKKQPSLMVVTFVREKPSAAELKAMAASGTHGEEIAAGKGCVYMTFPKGQGQSEMKRPKHGTARNWNTVTKLAAMAAE
jgi:uncharacterized protein (DUF1697 family)